MTMLETEEPAPGPVGLSEPVSHLTAEQWLPGGQGGRAHPGQGSTLPEGTKGCKGVAVLGGPSPESQVYLLWKFPDGHCLRDQAFLGCPPGLSDPTRHSVVPTRLVRGQRLDSLPKLGRSA